MEDPLQLTSAPGLGANLVTGFCRLCVSVTGDCVQLSSQISVFALGEWYYNCCSNTLREVSS